jgi:hypothetical protein
MLLLRPLGGSLEKIRSSPHFLQTPALSDASAGSIRQ